MSGDEKIVRDSWFGARYAGGRIYADAPMHKAEWILTGKVFHTSEAEAWSAAARFTEEHKRKIAENEEEIKLMSDDSLWLYTGGRDVIIGRILTHLQAIHADLKRGMRL